MTIYPELFSSAVTGQASRAASGCHIGRHTGTTRNDIGAELGGPPPLSQMP
jgi:hypothetical protein